MNQEIRRKERGERGSEEVTDREVEVKNMAPNSLALTFCPLKPKTASPTLLLKISALIGLYPLVD